MWASWCYWKNRRDAHTHWIYCRSQGIWDQLALLQNLNSLQDKDEQKLPIGGAKLNISISGLNDETTAATLKDNLDGTYVVQWLPSKPGLFTVDIAIGSVSLKGAPFKVDVKDPTSSKYSTITLVKVVHISVIVHAYTSRKEPNPTGGDHVKIIVKGPNGTVDHQLKDHNDGTYTVSYVATTPGDYEIFTTINGEPINEYPKIYSV